MFVKRTQFGSNAGHLPAKVTLFFVQAHCPPLFFMGNKQHTFRTVNEDLVSLNR